MSLLVEARAQDGSWRPVATLTPDSQPGSMSSNLPSGGRDVIMFWCDYGYSVISRSVGGADYETGPPGATRHYRGIIGVGTEELARLRAGESYELAVTTDRGVTCTVRWTHRA